MALLLDKPALAWPVGKGLILQRTLPAFIAYRTVQGVVHEEVLQHALLGLQDRLRRRPDLLAVRHGHEAGRLERKAARAFHLHQAHPTYPHRFHTRVIAEPRDVDTGAFRCSNDRLTGTCLGLNPIEDKGHASVDFGALSAWGNGNRVRHTGSRLPSHGPGTHP